MYRSSHHISPLIGIFRSAAWLPQYSPLFVQVQSHALAPAHGPASNGTKTMKVNPIVISRFAMITRLSLLAISSSKSMAYRVSPSFKSMRPRLLKLLKNTNEGVHCHCRYRVITQRDQTASEGLPCKRIPENDNLTNCLKGLDKPYIGKQQASI